MSSEDKFSTIKVIHFSGKQINWKVWIKKLLDHNINKGQKKISQRKKPAQDDEKYLYTIINQSEKKEKFRELNEDS